MNCILLSLLVVSTAFAQNDLKPLRAGIIGLDTSHVPTFTKLFNKGETVSRTKGPVTDQVTGVWKDGRVGTYRGIVKGKSEFGALVFGSAGVRQGAKTISYEALCRQIGTLFRTGTAPVSEAETLEIFTFMEAADESLRQGGKPVAPADVLAKAKAEAAKLME